MESVITEEMIQDIGKLRYKEGLAKSLVLVMECRSMCMDRDTQRLYGEIVKKIQAEMAKAA